MIGTCLPHSRRAKALAGLLLTSALAAGLLAPAAAQAAAPAFKTATPGVLTVATEVGNPGWMNGTDPRHISGGVEWAMANAFAKFEGIPKVEIRNAPFTPLISGSISGYDIGLMTIFKTPAREKVNQYSDCYYTEYSGGLVHKGTVLKTIEDARKLQWGHVTGGYAGLIIQRMKPEKAAKSFQDGPTEYNALLSNSIDGVLDDLSSVAGRAHSKGFEGTEVAAVFKLANEPVPCAAVQLPASAPKSNVEAVNAFLAQIQKDGRLNAWKKEYLGPNGADYTQYPMIVVP